MSSTTLKTRKEIANELGVSITTLKRWLEKEGYDLPKGRYLKPAEYEHILDFFGFKSK